MIRSKHVHLSNDGLSYSVTGDEEWRLSAEQLEALENIRYIDAVLRVANDPDLVQQVCEPRVYSLLTEHVHFVSIPLDLVPASLLSDFNNAPDVTTGMFNAMGRKIDEDVSFAIPELEKMIELVEPAYLRYLHRRGQLTPSGKKHLMDDDFSL